MRAESGGCPNERRSVRKSAGHVTLEADLVSPGQSNTLPKHSQRNPLHRDLPDVPTSSHDVSAKWPARAARKKGSIRVRVGRGNICVKLGSVPRPLDAPG